MQWYGHGKDERKCYISNNKDKDILQTRQQLYIYLYMYILLFMGIHMQVTKLFHCFKIRNTNSINAILSTLLVQKFWKMKQRTCSGIAVFVAKKGNSMDYGQYWKRWKHMQRPFLTNKYLLSPTNYRPA